MRRVRTRRRGGLFAALLMLVTLLCGLGSNSANADIAPPSGIPATVSSDGLPTVQINGVVWSQTVVGNTVYAVGHFSRARPAGAAPGTHEVARYNMLAYNLTTGALITTFNHVLNGQGLVVTASPNGQLLYVGGTFTTVDGKKRLHIAAFSTRTGALLGWAPQVSANVRAIASTRSYLYIGGDFISVGTSTRHRLASFQMSNGALTGWHPAAEGGVINALLLTPNGKRLVVAGHLTSLAGHAAYGIGAVNPVTGAYAPFAVGSPVRDAGPYAAISSLSTNGDLIFGTGYVYGGGGNFEGRFALDQNNGSLRWMNDCHGDSYATFVVGTVLYSASHAHTCATIGAFPETVPRSNHRILAETTYATGAIAHNTIRGYADFVSRPHSTQLDWYPDLKAGTYTGMDQAAWSIAGNSSYLAVGGEFTAVNGVPQQGLVRFGIASVAPLKQGPKQSVGLMPTATITGAGEVTVTWQSTWDEDNQNLTYALSRNGVPVFQTSANSLFWTLPTLTFTDTGLSTGVHYHYQVTVTDSSGNTVTGAASAGVELSY